MAESVSKRVDFEQVLLTILEDIELNIKQNESVAIIGPSGSGKSTLLSLLAGLDTPSSGDITVLGTKISDLDEDKRAFFRRGQIGFVFQSFHLFSGLSALENVKIALELSPLSFSQKEIHEKSTRWLETVGLSHRLHHFPSQLSGGEKQRVALARAFVNQPKLVFLDEPTGNLDSHTGEKIVDLIFELNKETTLVIVTHEMAIARRCSRIVSLKDGKMVDA